jgi:AcrR family transcriptional regulator
MPAADDLHGGPGRSPEVAAVDPRVQRTREAVLDAVREIVATSGIEAVTHARVAEVAGVGRASVYRHWPDRTHLLLDALAGMSDASERVGSGDLAEDLAVELGRLREVLGSSPFVPRFVALLGRAEWEPELAELRAEMLANGTRRLRGALRDAIDREELPDDLDLDDAVAELAGPLLFQRVLAGRAVTDGFVAGVISKFVRSRGDR